MPEAPFNVGQDSLYVGYYTSGDLECFLELGWDLPVRVMDLYAEFRCITNGKWLPSGRGLIGALHYFGLDAMGVDEKSEMRELAKRGGGFTYEEKISLLEYCESDVDALVRLLPRISRYFDCNGRICLRGRYTKAVARMEHAGVPIDVPMLVDIYSYWDHMKMELISRIDRNYGVYEGEHFRHERFDRWLTKLQIPWPRTETGRLSTTEATFKDMAKMHPEVAPLRELKASIDQLRLKDLAVGKDGRNRVLLSPFGTRTGRNSPSSSRFIFGNSVWIRGLIKPAPGCALAYIDWSAEEFAIGAVLSGDPKMIDAYTSGDPYLTFAKQAGLAPSDATKQTHSHIRDQFKIICLGVNYGMGANSLAQRIGCHTLWAKYLLDLHKKTFPVYWRWSGGAVDRAMTTGVLHNVYGWAIHYSDDSKPRFLQNFPIQGNGAEMMRLASCLATENGVKVVAPVHDAFLIEAPLDEIDQHIDITKAAMGRASRYVLNGFELRVDCQKFSYPNRFMDKRGSVMWNTVSSIIREMKGLGENEEAELRQ
jgi:DNA polymerase I-like protein with 3'-5' exonuclease and polymerase domains